jgi:ABC-type uncharacterized transport system substrate-binding protein
MPLFLQLGRRDFIRMLGGAGIAWPFATRAEGPAKLPTIGFLGTSTPTGWAQWSGAFIQRLHELGWIEGRTVAIEYRWAEGRNERFPEIAAEFVRLKVDVIFTAGTGIAAAKQATSVIPIVFALSNDPVGSGLVASLARPGGNVTGLCSDPLSIANRSRINSFALASRLPTMYGFREFVEAGGLICYGPNVPSLFRRAGDFVDRVLRGTKPSDIPIEQPTKFDLVINVTTAKALGLAIPDNLLALADEVIE